METASLPAAVGNYSVGAAWVAIIATVISAGALIALHPLSPEFEPSWRMVSEYANGQHRGLLTVVFLAWALSSIALTVALVPFATGWIGAIGLLFLILAGIGEAMGGLFDVNHQLHGVAFGLGVPALLIAAIVLTFATRRAGLDIPVWSAALPILSVVVMGVAMVMLFSSLKAAGITLSPGSQPLPALPDGVTAWNGYANRLVFAAYYLWVILAARAVLQQSTS
jgi:hypothetical protein